nr:hypothetical protein [Tanacetum cinerariifolium]
MTDVTPEVHQQSSSLSSGLISNMLNLNLDAGIDSIQNLNIKSTSLVDVSVSTNDEIPPSFVTILPPPHILLIHPLQQTSVTTPTIALSTSLQNLPTFGSLFKFEDRVKALEDDFLKFKQTTLFAEAVSSIPSIIEKYLTDQMNEAVKTVVQLQSNRLRDEDKAKNEDFINKIDENIKKIIKEQVKSQVPIVYDKHALWGISHWGDDDKLYTFKEGDYNRIRLQDIEDMLLLLVQGKLINLNIEERLALIVSQRMFTRSIVIKRSVEDLQLGIKSYQKKLNLTKPDTYISDLKRKIPYSVYSNPTGFIYHNQDKKNRLMRIDELHKFGDGTLNDVQSALDDTLKKIWMNYLP